MGKLKWACVLACLALMSGCDLDQPTQEALIQDGSEVATVAGMIAITADPATAAFAPIIQTGLTAVDEEALDILNGADAANANLTIQQLLNLAFSHDANVSKYLSLVQWVLPVLEDIPAVQSALNTTVAQANPNVIADLRAFFTGIELGLGDQATPAQLQELLRNNPRLKAASKKMGEGKFNPAALINALKVAAAKH